MSVDIDNVGIVSIPIETYNGDQYIFLDAVKNGIKHNKKTIYIDCQQLQSISSNHVSLLWKAMQHCKENDTEFVLKNVSEQVLDVFTTLDIADLFVIENSLKSGNSFEETKRFTSISFEPYESHFPLTVENIVKEKYAVGHHLEQTPILKQIIFEIQTIFYEVVTNIRIHSGLNSHTPVTFELSQMNDNIVLRFEDTGKAFNPTEHELVYNSTKAIKERMKNGFGIMMIKRMSDLIKYKREGNKNILTITKSWSKYDGRQ